jgi:soluble cytochrome b562
MRRRAFLQAFLGLFMSTTYHTAITTGAPANASTINAPLGALDAAINTVDARVTTIITDSSTSGAEVVDTRDGFSILAERMDAAYLRNNVTLVDGAYAASSASARRYTTVQAAMAAASPGATIILAPGVYTGNVTFTQDDIKLVGAGAAGYDPDAETFGEGTIINGTISLENMKRCTISDLTINATGGLLDGVVSGYAMTDDPLYQTLRNLVIVGSGSDAAAHGIVCQAGGHGTIDNITVYRFGHGIAIRTSSMNISNCYIELCNISAIIVKAATGSGDAKYVNINNIIIHGGQGIVIQSYDIGRTCGYVNVSNVTGDNNDALVTVEQVAGTCRFVNVANCTSWAALSATRGAFDVIGATDVTFTACTSHQAAHVGFRNSSGARVYLNGCTVMNPAGTKLEGYFAQQIVNGNGITGVVAHTTGTFSVADGAFTAVTGLTSLVDMVGLTASGYITVPITGTYRVRGTAVFASNSTGIRGLQFGIVAGAQFAANIIPAMAGGQATTVSSETVVALSAGAGIQLQLYQNSGGALNAAADAQLLLEILEVS